jgi:hypothetical protein
MHSEGRRLYFVHLATTVINFSLCHGQGSTATAATAIDSRTPCACDARSRTGLRFCRSTGKAWQGGDQWRHAQATELCLCFVVAGGTDRSLQRHHHFWRLLMQHQVLVKTSPCLIQGKRGGGGVTGETQMRSETDKRLLPRTFHSVSKRVSCTLVMFKGASHVPIDTSCALGERVESTGRAPSWSEAIRTSGLRKSLRPRSYLAVVD